MALELSTSVMQIAFERAITLWSTTTGMSAERLARVHPQEGFAQTDKRLTGFASTLFTELISPLASRGTAYVTFRGVGVDDQNNLRAAIKRRHPAIAVVPKEHLTLDFSLTAREGPTDPLRILVAMESEMNPLSKGGADPERLFGDFTKLCKVHADTKIFICRVTRGNEKISGKYVPKLPRFKNALRKTIAATASYQSTPAQFGVYIVETGQTGPWRVHTFADATEHIFDLK